MIGIVNYGLGNLGSIQNMLRKVGMDSLVVDRPEDLKAATKIVLPGVGAFDTGMRHLVDNGWLDILNEKVLVEKVPTLGICLGMQLMTGSSEEGSMPGLNWVKGSVKRFRYVEGEKLKIPHMGWNSVDVHKGSSLLSPHEENRFYFVHSYYVELTNEEDILCTTTHGRRFVSAFQVDNVVGVQFHPEKSHRYGIQLFRNFFL